ncbi:putative Peptidase C14 caspase catalytic subunit p20 [Candidatus Terasakiella magnetica]|nr:putative Peptidase C14 caspase catalytic subunit p20 [Candidatus Terasakiella magnetica]
MSRLRLLLCLLFGMVATGTAFAADDSLPPTPQLRIETGMHTAMINRMALVDGGRVVTVSDDKTARLWSAVDGRALSVLRSPIGPEDEGALYAVAAAGTKVAVAGRTGPSWDGGAHFVYLYDLGRDGERMVGRLGRLDMPVMALAFSRDGRWLAAGLQGRGGVVLYDLTEKKLFSDKDFRDTVQWLDFGADGTLAAASADGAVKLYPPGSNLQSPRIGGVKDLTPWGIALSPDGQSVALGSQGGDSVTVLAAKDLAPLRFLKGDGRKRGGFPVVAWSPDGKFIFGAGTYADGAGRWYARKWSADGKSGEDLALGNRTVTDLAVNPGGGLLYATTEPSWGLVGGKGFTVAPAFRDLRGVDLRTNADGGTVEFSTDGGKTRHGFSLKAGSFAALKGTSKLTGAVTSAAGLKVENWQAGGAAAKVNQRALGLDAAERGRALAFGVGGNWALGSDFYLRFYKGEAPAWKSVAPAAIHGLTLSADGRWVIAAFADGTIRWYRSESGAEALAFFPHADGRRWIVWTPDGYFDSGEGGEGLIGYHVNRGKKVEAEFVAIDQMYATTYRRDVVMNAFRGDSAVSAAASPAISKAPAAAPASAPTAAAPAEGLISKYRRDHAAPVEALVAKGMPPRVKLVELCAHDPVKSTDICQPATAVSTRGLSAAAPAVMVPSREVTLKIITEDRGGGVEETVVRRNGALVPTARALSPVQGNHHSEEHRMILDRGANLIDISAFAKGGKIESKEEDRVGLKVVFNPGGDDKEKDKDVVLHIIAVGANKYPNLPSAMQLDNSDHDARGIVKMMKASEGRVYSKVEAKVLIDEQATNANILKAIDEVVAATAPRPQDMVMVFFAGHGFAVDQEYYFVPANINPKGDKLRSQADVDRVVKEGGLNQHLLMQRVGKLQSAKVLLLLDTCHSGALINSGLGNATEQAEKSQNMSQTMGSAIGRAVIAAADLDEEALDGAGSSAAPLSMVGRTRFDPSDEASPESPHGLFTKFILQGLAGAADFSKDGVVTMSELATYVQEIVPGQALALGKQQRPSVSYKSRGPFSLRYVNIN